MIFYIYIYIFYFTDQVRPGVSVRITRFTHTHTLIYCRLGVCRRYLTVYNIIYLYNIIHIGSGKTARRHRG